VNRKQLWLVQGAHCEVPVVTGVFTDLHFNIITSESKYTSLGAQDQHLREIRSDEVAWKTPTHCFFRLALAWLMGRT